MVTSWHVAVTSFIVNNSHTQYYTYPDDQHFNNDTTPLFKPFTTRQGDWVWLWLFYTRWWYPLVFLSTRQLNESELWAELFERRVAKSWGLSPWQPICSATGRPTTRGFTLQMSRFYNLLLVVENHRQINTNHRSNAGLNSKYSEILATKAAPVFLKFESG